MDKWQKGCSISAMWKLFPLSLLCATASALAQETGTAYEALRVIGTQLDRELVNHVVSISGSDGTPQPETWKVVVEDRRGGGGIREIEVRDGRIESDRTETGAGVIGAGEAATIDTRRLNLNSSGAYTVASHTADKSHAQFATVSYTLRNNDRGEPVWIVTLLSRSGRPVGTIHIGATRGNIARTEGLFAGATMDDVETEQAVEPRDAGDFLRTAKSTISHTFWVAQHEARGMFERAKESFSDFIGGD